MARIGPVRPLPNRHSEDLESGVETGLVTRIIIVATIVLGQLWALTVALEASLLDFDGQAWVLAGFSIVSFVVVMILSRFDTPRRGRRTRTRTLPERRTYVSRPIDRSPSLE